MAKKRLSDSLSSGLQEPSRTQDLGDAWETSRRDLIAGRIDSLSASRERRLILRMAEEEGISVDDMLNAAKRARKNSLMLGHTTST